MKFSRLTVAIAAAAVLSPVLAATPAWAGDSGPIYSTGNDCVGEWMDVEYSDAGYFSLEDRATSSDDNDYCYIDYGFTRSLDDKRRFSTRIEDVGPRSERRGYPTDPRRATARMAATRKASRPW
jgi:hypothetical protein